LESRSDIKTVDVVSVFLFDHINKLIDCGVLSEQDLSVVDLCRITGKEKIRCKIRGPQNNKIKKRGEETDCTL